MTNAWPGWPPPATPPPRRPSLVGVAAACTLALLANLGTVAAAGAGLRGLGEQLLPTPAASAPVTPGGGPTPRRFPTPRGTPAQSTGPVTVTDDLRRGVVLIAGRTPAESVAGTGMVLSEDGYVLTNYHVVRSTESVTVTVASSGRRYPATLVGRDATKDVALLKLQDARGLDVVTLDADEVRIGDVVIAAGNANGQGYVTANRGNVTARGRSIQVSGASENDPPETLRGLLETTAPAWPGDSGGPMFDADLEVLGMTTAGSSSGSDDDKQVYAVPITTATQVVAQIRAGDESGTVVIGPKAFLGISAKADDSSALVVSSVDAGTPAAKAGLKANDTITSLDGRPIGSRSELSTVLDGIEPGATVPIEWTAASGVRRSGTVTLAASPLN